MILESDTKFEEKMTCGLGNNMRKFENFESTWKNFEEPSKIGTQNWDFYGWLLCQVDRKCMSLKLTGAIYVMTTKKDAKFEKELTSSKLARGI